MLTDAVISKTAAALAITGLLLLAFQQLPQKKTVSEALKTEKGKQVEILAKVSWAKESGQSVFFELDDGNKIMASISRNAAGKGIIKPNSVVSAKGIVSGGNGKSILLAREVNAVD